jgi:hypothetical protein
MSGQIQKQRPFGSSDKSDSIYGDMLNQLPSAEKAEAAVRSAREAARAALEQKIRLKREEKRKTERVCGCW